jgi:hypothetical protein
MVDNEFVAVWTAVPFETAISAHPRYLQPTVTSRGWTQCTQGSGTSMIWIPGERRTSELKAIASTESRLVIGGTNGAMTMIALSH